MEIPAQFAAEQAILRQNVALSVIKQNFQQQQALVNILDRAADNPLLSGVRGSKLNTSA